MSLLPDNIVPGRPYNQSYRLGKMMKARGHTDAYHICGKVDISPRQISRYLAGEAINADHLARLSVELNVPGGLLQEVINGGWTLEEAKEKLKGDSDADV